MRLTLKEKESNEDKRNIKIIDFPAGCIYCHQEARYQVTRSDGNKSYQCLAHAASWSLKNKMILPLPDTNEKEDIEEEMETGEFVLELKAKINKLNYCIVADIKRLFESKDIKFDIVTFNMSKEGE